MILFYDDWKKYPNAIINTETTNTTFVRLSSLYKEMGIKNHAFILALYDRNLVGVDPFDPDIPLSMQLRVTAECKLNPWFFFREILRAPAQVGSDADIFQANRGNIALFWSFFNHVMFALIQIRQTGKSFSTDGLMTYLMNIRCKSTEINLLTKDDNLRSANIKRLKDIDSELPFYLKQRTKNDVNNSEELTIKSLGNTYRAHVPQKSPKMAYNVGRGLSSPIFQIDEGPFQPNIAISLPAALAAGTALREKAKINNEPYGTIITTTAGKKDDRDGKYMYKFIHDGADWTEKFLDCKDQEELYSVVRRNSKGGVLRINGTFNHRQLGKDDDWLREKIEESAAVGEDAERDFFNKWTSGTQSSPLPLSILDTIKLSKKEPLHNEISKIGGYITRWFIPETQIQTYMNNNKTICSLDTSDASGGDDISFYLTDVSSGKTIATGTYNETNLIKFAMWLVDWLVQYKNITMLIERRSSGVAILDYLLLLLPTKGIDPFERLYNTIVNNHEEDKDRYKEICEPLNRRSLDIYERNKKAFGFATSGGGATSRSELYSTTLQAAAKNIGDKVFDSTTISQIAGLITKNGRVDHEVGEHDDMVVAWLLNYWFLSKARNLSHYGIDSSIVLSELNNKATNLSVADIRKRKEQKEIRDRIDNLLNQLKSANDFSIGIKIENELKFLNTKLILEENEKFSVSELIDSIKKEKRINRPQSKTIVDMRSGQLPTYYDPRKLVFR